MFMTGSELGELASGDLGGTPVKEWHAEIAMRRIHGSHHDDRHQRGIEGHLDPMRKAVEKQGGIETPVHVWHDNKWGESWLVDGHHRAQIAMDTNRLVPVVHHDQWDRSEAFDSAFLGPTSDQDYDNSRV
jgi:hypothetical protein